MIRFSDNKNNLNWTWRGKEENIKHIGASWSNLLK